MPRAVASCLIVLSAVGLGGLPGCSDDSPPPEVSNAGASADAPETPPASTGSTVNPFDSPPTASASTANPLTGAGTTNPFDTGPSASTPTVATPPNAMPAVNPFDTGSPSAPARNAPTNTWPGTATATNPFDTGPSTPTANPTTPTRFGDQPTAATNPFDNHSSPATTTTNVAQPSPVVINGKPLTTKQQQQLQQAYGVTPAPGNYWYDPVSGMHGYVGQPPAGFMKPGHDAAPLREDASAGNSQVYFNGRRLAEDERVLWSMFIGGNIQPGRYWLDGQMNIGVEGDRSQSVNLMQLAQLNAAIIQQAQARWNQLGYQGYGGAGGGGGGGGDNFWSSRFSAGNSNNQGQGYVSVPGHGPIGYGF